MDTNESKYIAQIEKLTLKCNKQTDLLMEKSKQLQTKKKELEQLEKRTLIATNLDSTINTTIHNNIMGVFNIFYDVVCKSIKDNAFYESRKRTENNKKYAYIDYGILKGYIEDIGEKYETSKVVKMWAKMGVIYQDENENIYSKYTSNGKHIRCILINKKAIDLVKESMLYD